MRQTFRKLLQQTIVRYIFIGGVAYSAELACLWLLIYKAHFSQVAGTAVSFWAGLLISFGLQKTLAFKDYRREKKLLQKQAAMYSVLVVWNYGFSLLIVALFAKYQPIVVGRTVALIVTTAWNYIIYKHYIFKSEDPGEEQKIDTSRFRTRIYTPTPQREVF